MVETLAEFEPLPIRTLRRPSARWGSRALVLACIVGALGGVFLWAHARFAGLSSEIRPVWRGAEAKRTIVENSAGTGVTNAGPVLANERAFVWDGGTFNGSNLYWSFQCASVEDCWTCVLSGGQFHKSKFTPFERLDERVLKGPQQYDDRLRAEDWRLDGITHGAHFIWRREDRDLRYIAIDFDTATVYGTDQSGGYDRGDAAP